MPVVTKRDIRVVDFIEKFKAARTTTLTMFYPSLLITQKRLKVLYDNKMVRRTRDLVTQEYIYYIKKPKQLRHCLVVTDFYYQLDKIAKIEVFQPEYIIRNLRADAVIGYLINGIRRLSFLEIQISNNPVDIRKYKILCESGAWEDVFTVFPSIIAVTNRKIPESDLLVIPVREDLSDINNLTKRT